MFDGKQVLTITNKIKSSDIGGLSKELLMRKGTGNYCSASCTVIKF